MAGSDRDVPPFWWQIDFATRRFLAHLLSRTATLGGRSFSGGRPCTGHGMRGGPDSGCQFDATNGSKIRCFDGVVRPPVLATGHRPQVHARIEMCVYLRAGGVVEPEDNSLSGCVTHRQIAGDCRILQKFVVLFMRTSDKRRFKCTSHGISRRESTQATGRSRKPCMPPSTARAVPVVEPEDGDARNAMAAATSSGFTSRP